MIRLGIVGCGLTGAVTAMLLKQTLPDLNVVILEKSRGTGGRMCTSRSIKGRTVDLGAQFISKTIDVTNTQERCYSELLEANLLKPLNEKIEGIRTTPSTVGHFVSSEGSGSLVKYFLKKSGCKTLFSHKVVKISSSNEKWLLQYENGSSHEFDAVILTLPIPQLFQMEGLTFHLQDHFEKLKAVEYCSRFAVGLFYDTDSDYFRNISHCAKFISNDPVVRFYSLDHRKRGTEVLPSVVIHTTKQFGKVYIDKDSTVTQNLIMNQIEKLFPQIPKPSEIKFHKWRYSQVETPYEGVQGCISLSRSPILVCGGDGFTYSTFEGCILSAENITKTIVNQLECLV